MHIFTMFVWFRWRNTSLLSSLLTGRKLGMIWALFTQPAGHWCDLHTKQVRNRPHVAPCCFNMYKLWKTASSPVYTYVIIIIIIIYFISWAETHEKWLAVQSVQQQLLRSIEPNWKVIYFFQLPLPVCGHTDGLFSQILGSVSKVLNTTIKYRGTELVF